MSRSHYTDNRYEQRWLHHEAKTVIYPHQRSAQSWPPNPIVEDELVSLTHEHKPAVPDAWKTEAQPRGDIDQVPIIFEVNQNLTKTYASAGIEETLYVTVPTNVSPSSKSSTAFTPVSDYSNHDRRYVYIPERGIEIPLTYDEPRSPKYNRPSGLQKKEKSRGRQDRPVVETNLPILNPLKQPKPHLQRLPSPCTGTPKSVKPSENRLSGEFLLSPDLMSPKIRSRKKRSQYFETINHSSKIDGTINSSQLSGKLEQGIRPFPRRYVSAMPQPGERAQWRGSITPETATPYPMSSDDSDLSSDELPTSQSIRKPGRNSPDSPHMLSMPRLEDFSIRKERKNTLLQQPSLLPVRAVSVFDSRVPSTNVTVPIAVGVQNVNTLLSTPRATKRQASPRGSPVNSPSSSPPTPPLDDNHSNRNVGQDASPKNTSPTLESSFRPTSRPSSPVQLLHTRQSVGLIPGELNRPESSKLIPGPRSQMTSPLPSYTTRDTSVAAAPRIDVRSPSPANHSKSVAYNTKDFKLLDSRHASLAPLVVPNTPVLDVLPIGQRRRTLSNVETRTQLYMDPASFQQTSDINPPPRTWTRPSVSDRPVSLEAQPPILPPCERPTPLAGLTDWYTLVGFPSCSICPSCRDVVSSTGYARYFKPSLSRSPGSLTRCGFSLPWVRMAWLLNIKQRRRDFDMIYTMAEVAVHEPPCPGKIGAIRQWYRVVDAESGKQVSGFDACSYCVSSLETMFPLLRGLFQKSRSHHPKQERACALRSDSKRFPVYVDLLEVTADHANKFKRPPNTLRFLELAKKMAAVRECSRDDMLLDQRWHTIAQIPELTVCEECYDEVVQPAINRGSSLASQFSRNPHRIEPLDEGVSCQLYSPRMRTAFADACKRNDLAGLMAMAVQRHRIEIELQARNAVVQKAELGDEERTERVKGLVEEWKRWE